MLTSYVTIYHFRVVCWGKAKSHTVAPGLMPAQVLLRQVRVAGF